MMLSTCCVGAGKYEYEYVMMQHMFHIHQQILKYSMCARDNGPSTGFSRPDRLMVMVKVII